MLRESGQTETTMRGYEYTVIPESDEEEGGYTVTMPASPCCITQGDSLEEAVEMAKDAIGLYLEELKERGEPIPVETLPPQTIEVRVDA